MTLHICFFLVTRLQEILIWSCFEVTIFLYYNNIPDVFRILMLGEILGLNYLSSFIKKLQNLLVLSIRIRFKMLTCHIIAVQS